MGWKTDVQSVVFEASDVVKNAVGDFTSAMEAKIGTFKAAIGTLVTGSSYIGINGQKIPEMRNSIREYVAAIQTHLDKVVEDASTVQAFHGEYAKAITDYVTAIKKVCQDYTSTLLEFSDNLDAIAQIYHSKDTEFASNISSTASEASSSTTSYSEQRANTTYGNTTSAR